MKSYKEHCYSSIDEVSNIIASSPELGGKLISGVTTDITHVFVTFTDTTVYSFTPPDCQQLGYLSSYTGLTMSESVELSWLVVSVLISAFIIKILKRTL